jgi:hypothetical protein
MPSEIAETAEELAKTLYGMGFYKFADSEISGMSPASELVTDIGKPLQV